MRHTLSVLFENSFNAIPRIAGLFSGRGYNITSISFGQGEDPEVTRATITTDGDERIIEQIAKQLNKLVDVVKVIDLTYEPFVERELALVKVQATPSTRAEIMQITDIFRAKIIDVSGKTVTIEITGKSDKIDAAIGMLEAFGIREIARTGAVALKREFKK
ncbi:MAG TPA: acetolactate synthase small subunit [bacterium]|nr:acetolactate synthase small subunit [bacterium]